MAAVFKRIKASCRKDQEEGAKRKRECSSLNINKMQTKSLLGSFYFIPLPYVFLSSLLLDAIFTSHLKRTNMTHDYVIGF